MYFYMWGIFIKFSFCLRLIVNGVCDFFFLVLMMNFLWGDYCLFKRVIGYGDLGELEWLVGEGEG